MKKNGKKILLLSVAAVLLAALTLWIVLDDFRVQTTEYTVTMTQLPASFEGLRIAQVSDLHNSKLGDLEGPLLKQLRDAAPDLIVLTGDLADFYRTDIDRALTFVREAAEIAPTYYITGNHEARLKTEEQEQLFQGLTDAGVTILRNEAATVDRNGASITLVGLEDPDFGNDLEAALDRLLPAEGVSLVLSHRPEYFDAYCSAGVQLVFAGHAHGGQFRLPFIGGLAAPGQGLFPKYDCGLYQKGETQMLVSRGVGESLFPFRVNNPPELVVAILTSDSNNH